MKCRKKVEIQVAKFIKMKNGKPATEAYVLIAAQKYSE
jgi:hypothetical protein